MKNEELKIEDFQEWLNETEFTYASRFDGEDRKSLRLTTSGGFRIYINGVLYWEGIQPYRAIQKFNEL